MIISILGAGWLGLPLAEALIKENHTVKGSTTTASKLELLKQQEVEPYLINLNESGELDEAFFQTDLLIITLPPGRRDPDVLENYPARIQRILGIIKGKPIKGIIYTSSTSVYGRVEGIVNEETSPNPVTNSGKAVWQVEQMLNHQAIPVTIVRFGGLVGGTRQAGRFFAGKKNLPDGNAPVNFVRREDCIGAIQAVINQNAWGKVYNICADEHPLKKDFYPLQAQKMGLESPTFTAEKTTAYKIVSNQKIKAELDYQFRFPNPMDF